MSIIEDKIKLLPDKPGCYIMYDASGTVIYVGKAKILKNRVKSYFYKNVKTEKTMALVSNVADFSYVITNSELDALSLENNLIKKYKPKYNIMLKDDRQYPYLRINLKEDFPSFTVVRKIKNDGAKYYGPFMGGVNIEDVLEIVYLAYSLRSCSIAINPLKPKKECLNYHINRCLAPCAGKCTKEDYRERVFQAIDFLSGNDDGAERVLKEKMRLNADNQNFELALNYRDKLKMLARIKQKKITSLNRFINADIVSFVSNGVFSAVNVLVTRNGRMQGAKNFAIETRIDSAEEALNDFLLRYYSESELPDEIITNIECAETGLIERYLQNLSGKLVVVSVPKQGIKKQLSEMAENNARDYLEKTVGKIRHKEDMTTVACERLKELLKLKRYPRRMECYDISNISGTDKVGSMVVFLEGEPDRDSYRRFKIETVEGSNDFACLAEVLRRRLSKLGTDEEANFPRPDLVIIDGGKGQLSSVAKVFEEFGCDIDLISLAKREEEIYTLGDEFPIVLDKRDFMLKLLMRIRDEAHRFAITYHRTIRSKRMLASALDSIDGIGEKKRKLLIKKFGDVEAIRNASLEELMEVESIGEKQAQTIKAYFSEEHN